MKHSSRSRRALIGAVAAAAAILIGAAAVEACDQDLCRDVRNQHASVDPPRTLTAEPSVLGAIEVVPDALRPGAEALLDRLADRADALLGPLLSTLPGVERPSVGGSVRELRVGGEGVNVWLEADLTLELSATIAAPIVGNLTAGARAEFTAVLPLELRSAADASGEIWTRVGTASVRDLSIEPVGVAAITGPFVRIASDVLNRVIETSFVELAVAAAVAEVPPLAIPGSDAEVLALGLATQEGRLRVLFGVAVGPEYLEGAPVEEWTRVAAGGGDASLLVLPGGVERIANEILSYSEPMRFSRRGQPGGPYRLEIQQFEGVGREFTAEVFAFRDRRPCASLVVRVAGRVGDGGAIEIASVRVVESDRPLWLARMLAPQPSTVERAIRTALDTWLGLAELRIDGFLALRPDFVGFDADPDRLAFMIDLTERASTEHE